MLAEQVLALIIFISMFVLIVLDKIERHYVTLGCGALTLIGVFGIIMKSPEAVIGTLNLRSIFTTGFWYQSGAAEEAVTGINWSTIIFIAGMMIMVEVMAAAGFFRWLCMLLAKAVHYRTRALFITFMVMSFGLAMFIDSITVILFLAAVSIELAKLLKFNPVPMILSEIFCANLGGSATMCGDPPNIIIGTSLNFSFSTFITHTGLIAVISLVFIVVYFLIAYRKELESSPDIDKLAESMPSPAETITNRRDFALSCVIFMCAVVMLVTHALTGLTVAFIGLVIAIFSLIVSGRKALHMLKSIDYKTLLFFLGLFIVVGGLEQTGILEIIAQFQFDYIRKKAESGESFVVVGRCSENVLKDYDCLISVFVTGDKEHKIQRVMEHFDLSESEAYTKMRRHDRTRKQYHNRYSEGKWGDATYYDMCINSSPLGIEKTVNVLENYVKERTGNQEL